MMSIAKSIVGIHVGSLTTRIYSSNLFAYQHLHGIAGDKLNEASISKSLNQ